MPVIQLASPFKKIAAVMIVLALVMRIIISSGFMPSAERSFALTICAGIGTQTVWLDKSGTFHKEDPSKGKSIEHQPCVFASAAIANDARADDFHVVLPPVALAVPVFVASNVSVGAGLAAPPPPAIGPPSYI